MDTASEDPDAAIIVPRHNIHHRVPQRMARWYPLVKDICRASAVTVVMGRHQAYNIIFGEMKPCTVIPAVRAFEKFFDDLSQSRQRKVADAFRYLYGFSPHQISSNGNRMTVINLLEAEFLPDPQQWIQALRRLRRIGVRDYQNWWASA